MLRRHHQGEPDDTESDTAPPDTAPPEPDTPKDAPQPKAAGRSPSRSKTTKGG